MSSAAILSMKEEFTSPLAMEGKLHRAGLLNRTSHGGAGDALLPLLEALGWKGDGRELADLLVAGDSNLRWSDLANILRALGYDCDETGGCLTHTDVGELPVLFLPRDRSSPMILQERTANGFMARVLANAAVEEVAAKGQAGTLWHIEPIVAEEAAQTRGNWLRQTLQKFRYVFRDVLVLGLLINLFALSVPLFTMLTYDRVIAGHNVHTLYYLLAGAAIALVAEGVFRQLRALSLAWLGVRINQLVTLGMFQRLLALEPLVIERAPPAAQIVRAKALEAMRDFLTGQGFILFIEFPFLPVLLIALLALAPPMALACVVTAVVLVALLATQLRAVRANAQRSARAMSERQRDVLEMFSKLETLRLDGLSDALYERFRASNARAISHAGSMVWRMQVIEHLVLAISMAGGLATLVCGVQTVWAGDLSPGGLIACMIIAWRVLMPLQQLAAIAPRLEQVSGGMQQFEQLIAIAPERVSASETAAMQPVKGQVELINVAMRYPRQLDTVFAGLSMQITPGELVTIAGANGSGKSSVLKLVNGMYKQAAGSIRLDGIDIRQFDPLALRRGITYISQSASMFSGTLAENLTITAPFADEKQIADALEKAGALDEVLALPDGFSTRLGSDGFQLPQALLFKLTLARAYIDLKPLVLCDELPYALLSTEAGECFRQYLATLKGKHTVLLVAHTTDLVRMADQAIYLRANRRPVVGAPSDILPLMLEQTHGNF